MRRPLTLVLLGFGLLYALLAGAGERKVWTTSLSSHQELLRYSTPVNGVPFTKFVIVPDTDTAYFFWTAVYPFHYHFVNDVLLVAEGKKYKNIQEFNASEHAGWERRFHLGALSFRKGIYSYEFLESDVPPVHVLRKVDSSLRRAAPFMKASLRYRPVSDRQKAILAKAPDIPWVAADFVSSDKSYQLLTSGEAVGRLRLVEAHQEVAGLALGAEDVVVLGKVPDDIAPVAGILANVFSSPLGHVNLRARAWGIPNAAQKGALKNARGLKGKIVYYKAGPSEAALRLATKAEVEAWRARKLSRSERRKIQVPGSDLSYRGLPALVGLTVDDVKRVGTKGANLGQMATHGGAGVFKVPAGFCVPFGYYADHMQAHELGTKLRKMLADKRFRSDAKHRQLQLTAFRKAIVDAPFDAIVGQRITAKAKHLFGAKGAFVRSSTNAEDLPGFNGAGLYDTVPNVKGPQATLAAVKQVWASVWNFRAYEERERAGIDHLAVYPAVLLQVAVSAVAAGVLVTSNIFDSDAGPGVFINAKRGLGMRVVGGSRVPEQVLFDEITRELRVISRSDDPVALVFDEKGGVREVKAAKEFFLTEGRVRDLVRAAKTVRQIFQGKGAQDVEWLMTADEQVWVVQSRPFVDPGSQVE